MVRIFDFKKLSLLLLFCSPIYASFDQNQIQCKQEGAVRNDDLLAVSFRCQARVHLEVQQKQNKEWQFLYRYPFESFWTRDVQWVQENDNLYLQFVMSSPWHEPDTDRIQIEAKSVDHKYRLLRKSEKTEFAYKDILILQVKDPLCEGCWKPVLGIPRIEKPYTFSLEYQEGGLFARIGPGPKGLIKLLEFP